MNSIPFRTILFLSILNFFLFAQMNNEDVVEVGLLSATEKLIPGQENHVAIQLMISHPWHINSNNPSEEFLIPTEINLEAPSGVTITELKFPPAQQKTFEFSENPLWVYEDTIYIRTTIILPETYTEPSIQLKGTLTYQACNDETCLPPRDKTFSATFQVAAANEEVNAIHPEVFGTTTAYTPPSPNDGEPASEFSSTLESKGFFLAFIGIFIAGLLLNLTPCVYPLIPITLSYFGGQAGGKKGNLVIMSFLYVLGMAITYSILGVAAALTGSILGVWLQNPYVLIFIALVMVGLALSMFGVYEIQVPPALANFAGQSKQGYLGTLFMGLTVGIIAAPCIGPFVLGLLTYVGEKGDPFLGFLMFFVLALGLGTPFLFLGIFSGSINRLPHSGAWMVWVRKIFGFILVGMAFYFIEPLFTNALWYYTLLALTAFIGGVYLGWIDPTPGTGKLFPAVKTVVGIAFLFIAAFFWVTSVEAYVDQRISNLSSDSAKLTSVNRIQWAPYSPQKLQEALQQQKPVMIDFFADWCIPCKELDKFTFTDPRVVELSRNFIMLKADLTRSQSTEVKQLQKQYHIKGVPTLVFLDPTGKEIPGTRVVSYVPADEFVPILEKVLNLSRKGEPLVTQ